MREQLKELYNPNVIAAYWTEAIENREPYLGKAFFPLRKKAGLDLAWIRGHKGLPVTLMPSAFDAKARYRTRELPAKVMTEMPFFREGFVLKERDRQELMRAREPNDPYVNDILSRAFDDVSELINGAAVVRERMRMQLLAPVNGTPGISIIANDVSYVYNYDPKDEYRETNYMSIEDPNDMWNSPNSNPLQDLRAAQDAIETRTGTRPTVAIMTRNTFDYLLANEHIRSVILAQNLTANIFMTDQIVQTAIQNLLGIRIAIYTKKYVDDDKTVQNFFPDDFVTLMPNGPVGQTWFGTTPEEADLIGGNTNASVSIVDTGVAITTIMEPHPVNIQTIASQIVLPSYERMDEVFAMRVVSATAG